MKKEKKNNRKLLFQMSVIVLPIFIVMIVAVIYSVYDNTVKSFLQAQDPYMQYLLDRSYGNSIEYMEEDNLEWFIEYWHQHPDIIVQKPTEEEKAAFDKELEKEDSGLPSKDSIWGINWLRNCSDTLKSYCAKMEYSNLISSLKYETGEKNIERLFIMDVTKEHEGEVICDYQMTGLTLKLGTKYNFKLSDHPEVQRLIKDTDVDFVFEMTKDFPEDGSFYICYRPITIGGEVRAVMGIVYNWDDFQSSVFKMLRKALFVSVGGILLALTVLQVVLFRKAIKPVTKIQTIVRDYKNNKNSEEVIARMGEIKERNEFGLLSEDIAELASAMEYHIKQNIKLAGERERVAAELDMATRLQASQLPREIPAFPDRKEIDIFATMTPAKEVGGDFYDYFFIDDDHLAMVMADVSGKGIPAALFMMMTKMLLTDNAKTGMPPHEVLERTNDTICKHNELEMFVTMWFGILEISTGKITASNAGHEYPVIRKPDGQFEIFKDKHCFVIGGMEGMVYSQYEFTLEKGGTLFLYTDGVPEATDADKQLFGMQRLVDTLNAHLDEKPQQLLENVHSEINRFVGDEPQFDDLTMLGITLL